MSALTSSRNTAEILCRTQKFHRIRAVKENAVLQVSSIAANDKDNGLAEPASDTPDLIVLGRVEGFTIDGRDIDCDGQVIVELGNLNLD